MVLAAGDQRFVDVFKRFARDRVIALDRVGDIFVAFWRSGALFSGNTHRKLLCIWIDMECVCASRVPGRPHQGIEGVRAAATPGFAHGIEAGGRVGGCR
jgi:hypothetical protein